MEEEAEEKESGRRDFLGRTAGTFMAAGLASSYGACAAMGARYLFPARPRELRWLFVVRASDVRPGDSIDFVSPSGEKIAIARRDDQGTADDFVALSSVCPHLGCQVHWEAHNTRFFCPCHNGVFTPEGEAVEGPPADAGQSLARYPLDLEAGLLYIRVPVDSLPRSDRRTARHTGPDDSADQGRRA